MVTFTIELDREEDGRWIADVPALPGVLAYGATQEEAIRRVQVLAFRVLAEQLEHEPDSPLVREGLRAVSFEARAA